LPGGNHKLSVTDQRVDGQSGNLCGNVQVLTTDGVVTKTVDSVNVIDTRGSTVIKMAIAEEQTVMFRVTVEQHLNTTFKVERLRDE
jgi:hypothetical protein